MDQKLTGRKRALYLLFVAAFLFVMVSPMLYMISASFMTESDLNHIPPRILPSAGTIKNYVAAFVQQPLLRYVFNSFVITIIAVVICITAGCMASYALTRTNIRFKTVFLLFVLTISLLPTITLINPIFKMYSKLGLLNTHIGLALIVSVLDLPMTIWFLTAVFKGYRCLLRRAPSWTGPICFRCSFILYCRYSRRVFSRSASWCLSGRGTVSCCPRC